MRQIIHQTSCDRCGGGVEPDNPPRKIWGRSEEIPDGWTLVEVAASGNPNSNRLARELCAECTQGLLIFLGKEPPMDPDSKLRMRLRLGPFALELNKLGDGWLWQWTADNRSGDQKVTIKAGEARYDTSEQAEARAQHWFEGLLLRVLGSLHKRTAVE